MQETVSVVVEDKPTPLPDAGREASEGQTQVIKV